MVALTPWKELLTPIEKHVGWSPEPVCPFLVKQNLPRPCWEWNPATIKTYHSYCIDYATQGTLSLGTLFTHDARQQFPLRNIPFSKQKKMIWKGTGLDGKTRKGNNYLIVSECIPNPC
jgi:hypothetical protein